MKIIFQFFLLIVLGIIIIVGARYIEVDLFNNKLFLPQPNTFTLEPPTDSLIGKIATSSGEIQKLSRNKDEPEIASAGAAILQGEVLTTKSEATASVQITDYFSVDMDENSQAVFTNLIPKSFLIKQTGGHLEYSLLNTFPLSIRALHSLIKLTKGQLIVDHNAGIIKAHCINCSAQLAIIDLDNNTQIYELKNDQKATIYDIQREVIIR